jgi:hypothetical protein
MKTATNLEFLVYKKLIPENAQKLKDNSFEFIQAVRLKNRQTAEAVSNEAFNTLTSLLINIRKSQDNREFNDFFICDKDTSYYLKDVNSVNKTAEDIWNEFKNNPNSIDYKVSQNLTIRRFANINAHGDYIDYYIDNNDNHWLCFKNKPNKNFVELIIVNIQKVCDAIIANLS